eukprot:9067615-Alexandrium_andersonii.AAC.1
MRSLASHCVRSPCDWSRLAECGRIGAPGTPAVPHGANSSLSYAGRLPAACTLGHRLGCCRRFLPGSQ